MKSIKLASLAAILLAIALNPALSGENPAPEKIVAIEEAAALQGKDFTERIGLAGEFRVTAVGEDRAVLRTEPPNKIRILVEYMNLQPPPEGASVIFDAKTPLLVTAVRQGADGVTTVYTRQIPRAEGQKE